MLNVEILKEVRGWELVKVGDQKLCYQVNSLGNGTIEDFFCIGAFDNFEDAEILFDKKSNYNEIKLIEEYENDINIYQKKFNEAVAKNDYKAAEHFEEMLCEFSYEISNIIKC